MLKKSKSVSKAKFKIGDKVLSKIEDAKRLGIIRAIVNDNGRDAYGVEFLTYTQSGFHDLDGKCPRGKGFWIYESDIEKYKEGDEMKILNDFINSQKNKLFLNSKKNIEDNIKHDKDEVEYLAKKIDATNKTIEKHVKNLSRLKESPKVSISDQLEKIKKHKLVDSIEIIENNLFVKTKPILYSDSNYKNLPFGRYIIKLDLSNQNIYGASIDYAINGYSHPCISGLGFCFGSSFQDEVHSRFREYNLDMVIILIINFLQEPNYDHPHIHINDFIKSLKKIKHKESSMSDYFSENYRSFQEVLKDKSEIDSIFNNNSFSDGLEMLREKKLGIFN